MIRKLSYCLLVLLAIVSYSQAGERELPRLASPQQKFASPAQKLSSPVQKFSSPAQKNTLSARRPVVDLFGGADRRARRQAARAQGL